MKTRVNLVKLLAMAGVVFCCGLGVLAQSPENVSLVALSNKKVFVLARNPLKQPMSIVIENSLTGESVYNADLFKDENWAKIYNLSNLPEGGYKLSFRIDNRIYEKELLLKDPKPVLVTETMYSLPEFHKEANNLILSVVNPRQKDVRISFWKNSESFFTDKPVYSGSFKRKYNLSNLEPGEYSVEFVSGGDSYAYPFVVR